MSVISAGLLVYRRIAGNLEVLLAHPGGPYWKGRDEAAWSIPKGAPLTGEPLLTAALREFEEETGLSPPCPSLALPPMRTGSGKMLHVWAAEGDLNLTGFHSVTVELVWPPGTGRRIRVPEVDALRYFARTEALRRAHRGQRELLAIAFERLAS